MLWVSWGEMRHLFGHSQPLWSLPSAIIRVSIRGMPSFWYLQTPLPMSLFCLSCHWSPLFSPYVLGCWCFHELLCGNGLVDFSYDSFVKFSSPGIYFFSILWGWKFEIVIFQINSKCSWNFSLKKIYKTISQIFLQVVKIHPKKTLLQSLTVLRSVQIKF